VNPDSSNQPAPDIRCQNVGFAYPDGTRVLENISFEVMPGERLGVLGPNGGGKSTLINLILGELRPSEGQIVIKSLSPLEARSRGLMGAVPQHTQSTSSVPLNVRQVVTYSREHSLWSWRPVSSEVRDHVDETLDLVGLSDADNLPVDALSQGQRQRLRIAQALVNEPAIFILDEPDVGIDAAGQRRFSDLLDRLHRDRGLTIIIVSHNIRAIASTCDRVLCIARHAHVHASPEGLTPAVLAEVFQHDMAHALGQDDREVHVDAHFASECQGHHPTKQDHDQA
jgi:zinc transport system ATP-binding protein